MGQDLKTCNNCVHISGSGRFAKCSRYTSYVVVDLVTGHRTEGEYYHADTNRAYSHLCGKSGKWYEDKVQKPSLLQRLKTWLSQ